MVRTHFLGRMATIALMSITAVAIGGTSLSAGQGDSTTAGALASSEASDEFAETPTGRGDADVAVARVNGEPITLNELTSQLLEQRRDTTLEYLINRKILEQSAHSNGVAVSEREIDDEVARVAEKFQLTAEELYEKLAKHLSQWVIGTPMSPALMEIFEILFPDEEAEVASKLPLEGNSIEESISVIITN